MEETRPLGYRGSMNTLTHLNRPRKAAKISASCWFIRRSSLEGTAKAAPEPPTRCTSARTVLYLQRRPLQLQDEHKLRASLCTYAVRRADK